MKKILCLILVFVSLVSLSSCGKIDRDEKEVLLELAKEAMLLAEIEAEVKEDYNDHFVEFSSICCYYDMDGVLYQVIFYGEGQNEYSGLYSRSVFFSSYGAETEHDKALAQLDPYSHYINSTSPVYDLTLLGGRHECKELSKSDLKRFTEEVQNFLNDKYSKFECIRKILDRQNAVLDYIQKNELFNEINAHIVSDPDSYFHLNTHPQLCKYINSLSEDEKGLLRNFENPWHKYATLKASESVKSEIKANLKNPDSLQIHSQRVEMYKVGIAYYFEVTTDYSAQNGFGGFVRERNQKNYYKNPKYNKNYQGEMEENPYYVDIGRMYHIYFSRISELEFEMLGKIEPIYENYLTT